jgi:hypothetical protein
MTKILLQKVANKKKRDGKCWYPWKEEVVKGKKSTLFTLIHFFENQRE